MVNKLTPILVVENIESSLPFWVDRLGFEKTAEVPHEGALGFVILTQNGVEIMLQTRASAAADIPALATPASGRIALYIEVTNIEEVEEKLAGVDIVVPLRQTSYGMAEIFVRDPAGNLIGFAAQAGY